MAPAKTSKKPKNKKVVVFGSCNLDLFFDVPNLNFFVDVGMGAEDALHFPTHKQAPGGKGANQAVAAARAGADVHFYGAIGKGAHGRFLLENFKKYGINTKGVKELDEPTGVAVIFNQPNGKHKVVVSHAANMLAHNKDVPDSVLNKDTILVFQAETDLRQNDALILRGKKRGATIVYNVAPAVKIAPKVLACIDYLILNRPEAEVIAESLGMSARDLPLFAEAMAKKFNLTCIVTLGELGALVAGTEFKECLMVPSLSVKAIDTIGAGDAFVGAFAAALASHHSTHEALFHGVVAGSLACTKVGAQSAQPSAADIKKALPKLNIKSKQPQTSRKIAA